MKFKHLCFYTLLCLALNGCMNSTALLSPAITAGATGNMQSAGLSFGTNVFIEKKTGKTSAQNLKNFLLKNRKIRK